MMLTYVRLRLILGAVGGHDISPWVSKNLHYTSRDIFGHVQMHVKLERRYKILKFQGAFDLGKGLYIGKDGIHHLLII